MDNSSVTISDRAAKTLDESKSNLSTSTIFGMDIIATNQEGSQNNSGNRPDAVLEKEIVPQNGQMQACQTGSQILQGQGMPKSTNPWGTVIHGQQKVQNFVPTVPTNMRQQEDMIDQALKLQQRKIAENKEILAAYKKVGFQSSGNINKKNVTLVGGGEFKEGEVYVIRDKDGKSTTRVLRNGNFVPLEKSSNSAKMASCSYSTAGNNEQNESNNNSEVKDNNLGNGSDQVLYCDVCLEDKEKSEAVAFCVECNDYLCLDCKRGHVKNRTSRHHHLLDADSMPKKKLALNKSSNIAFESSETCQQHKRALTHLCQQDDEMGCELCMFAYHSQCKGVLPINNITNEEKNGADFQTTLQNLDDIHKKFELCKNVCKKNEKMATSMYAKAYDSFNDILSALKANDLIQMSSIAKACDSILGDISALKGYLETQKAVSQPSKVFVALKIADKQINNMKKSFEKIDADNTISRYQFEPRKTKPGLKINRDPWSLGQLLVNNGTIPYFNINIESPTYQTCTISDMHMLSTDVLFVVDVANKKIKLIDTKGGVLTFELELLMCPIKAAKISGTQFAVTLYGGKVQFMTVSLQTNMINLGTSFNTDGFCSGITYIPHISCLAVGVCKPGRIQILDMVGTIKHTIPINHLLTDKDGLSPFFHLMEMEEKLYMNEPYENMITCLDLNGQILATTHQKEDPRKAGYIVKGPGKDLLVVFSKTPFIEKFDPQLQRGQPVLAECDMYTEQIDCVCYCQETQTLYVGDTRGNVRRFFYTG